MLILSGFYASHNPKLTTRNLSGNLSLVGVELDKAAMHIMLKTLRVSGWTPLMGEFTISPIGMVESLAYRRKDGSHSGCIGRSWQRRIISVVGRRIVCCHRRVQLV